MNFHNTTQLSYLRPVTNIGLRQHLQPRGVVDLLGGVVLWKAVGKVLLVLLPLMLAANMFLAGIINNVGQSISSVDDQRHELMDKNIGLLAQKARLYAPERVGQLAEQKLSLYAASPGQIERIN
ncbi:MAG: hypothetical protein OEL83_17035 [Desulforhopalus sp.]|nr:hypothetical protein [Desulforhopalus sp.]